LLDQVVDLVLVAFENGQSGYIFVQKAPAATVKLLAHIMKNILGKSDHKIKNIGTRYGKKLYETLLTKGEMVKAIDMGEYHSHNTHRLNEEKLTGLLLDLKDIQNYLKEL
jgi:UDP-N-acetylglucosamine 4,6-dehydratase/5-epimerase